MLAVQPRVVAVRPAGEVVPGLEPGLVLHAAPPQPWEEMSELLRGGMVGAALAEGLATTPEDAAALAASGEIRFGAAQDHAAMAGGVGSITSSTPVVVVRDEATGREAFHPVMEGLTGEALVLGMYTPAVLERLRWMREELAPMLDAAVRAVGGIDAGALIAEALRRGDELHNRNAAASSMLAELLGPGLAAAAARPRRVERASEFLRTNPQFFVAVSLAAGRLACDAADGVPGSGLVTACGSNGTEAGLRVSGAARPVVHGARRGPRRRAVRRLHRPTTRAGPAATRSWSSATGWAPPCSPPPRRSGRWSAPTRHGPASSSPAHRSSLSASTRATRCRCLMTPPRPQASMRGAWSPPADARSSTS